jgi:probable rRNA maturation factor
LNHNYVTDIITFPYTENEKLIDGELFISLEQVKKNSKLYGSLKNEIRRVIIHGCLHLLGYDDRTQKQALLIRQKEDYYLSKEK